MKIYHSTRELSNTATADEAVLRGIAPDGGLYVPDEFTKIDLEKMLNVSAYELFARVLVGILDGYSYEEMLAIVKKGYEGRFETSDVTPTVSVGDMYVLELFRGPTSAFKDVALSLLPHFITRAARNLGVTDEIRILTATSGDTGKAALAGFADVPGTSIAVFYPEGGVSAVQRKQMVTQPGGNVHVCAVRGNFDDAQTGVKRILSDKKLAAVLAARGVRFSSANSINLGRLAPQAAYYFKAYLDLVRMGRISIGDKVDFAVPTGNFGDILAGEYARCMGLPVGRLICASNANRVLTDFLETGVYDRRREFFRTASPSMDILVSSNLERCLYLMSGGDCALVRDLMKQLGENGVYTAPESLMQNFRASFAAGCADDPAALDEIGRVWREHGYLMDTHTAVGSRVAREYMAKNGSANPMVVLSTASPYKFASDVLRAVGGGAAEGFDALDELNRLTGVPVPANLSSLRTLTDIHTQVVDIAGMADFAARE
jgi:threonine synthase